MPSGGYVFTKTKHNYFWQQHFPDKRIYNTIEPEMLDAIMEDQKKRWDKFIAGKFTGMPYTVVVFDDVISDRKNIRYNDKLDSID